MGTRQNELTRKNLAWTKARNEPEGIRMFPAKAENCRNISRCFQHFKIQYHTYTLDGDIMEYAVIKGIPEQTPIYEVFDELRDRGIDM